MDNQASQSRGMVWVGFAFECALGVLAIALGWLFARSPLAQFAWTLRGFGYGLAATMPLVVFLVVMSRYSLGPFKDLARVVRELIVPLFAGAAWWEVAAVSAAAGWGEELLFRGVLQPLVAETTGQAWLGLAVASIVFGLVHPISPMYVAMAALIGGYLGWLLIFTDNLLVPIVVHGTYDFIALTYFLHGRNHAGSGEIDQRPFDTVDELSRS